MDGLVVAGGRLVGREHIVSADLVVRRGRIDAVGADLSRPAAAPVLDASNLLVAPGFIDTQVNGAVGINLTADPDRLADVAAALPRYGVTSFLPTVISSAADVATRLLDTLGAGELGGRGATPLGAHFEGPMLNPARRGAHPTRYLRTPSPDLIEGWSRQDGVAMVTLAPELPGALDAVRLLVARGVVVAAGHTDATTDEVLEALDAGVSHLTHLFNAMRPLHHREPGPIGVALGHPTLTAGLIADGVHLHPRTVAAAWAAMGRRLNLVSDAVAVLGSGKIGGLVNDEGVLAGSATPLDQSFRNLVTWTGCTIPDAVATVTSTPADLLGRADKGRLSAGADADLVLLDSDLAVVATVIAGVVVHDVRRGPSPAA
jgi:N-acetylglucosamine-6-phosphate deacetylase